MNRFPIVILLLLLAFLINNCNTPEPSHLSLRADSLIQEVVGLNNKIISANLDSIQHIYSQIIEQHTLLAEHKSKFSEVMIDEERFVRLDTILLTLGFCLKACNEFQSEVSVIESHLQQLKDAYSQQSIPDSTLKKQLDQESALLKDLITRISMRMDLMYLQLGSYDSIQHDISTYLKSIERLD
jgi:hypothetical protein